MLAARAANRLCLLLPVKRMKHAQEHIYLLIGSLLPLFAIHVESFQLFHLSSDHHLCDISLFHASTSFLAAACRFFRLFRAAARFAAIVRLNVLLAAIIGTASILGFQIAHLFRPPHVFSSVKTMDFRKGCRNKSNSVTFYRQLWHPQCPDLLS